MDTYWVIRSTVLIIISVLISMCIVADVRAGQRIESQIKLALISALVAMYTFAH
jgi:hypothetical protein